MLPICVLSDSSTQFILFNHLHTDTGLLWMAPGDSCLWELLLQNEDEWISGMERSLTLGFKNFENPHYNKKKRARSRVIVQ